MLWRLWTGSRIVAGFGYQANTLGISLKSAGREQNCTAGCLQQPRLRGRCKGGGVYVLDGDAFSEAMRDQTAEVIRQDMGQIDLVVYSLASPVRRAPYRRTAPLQH